MATYNGEGDELPEGAKPKKEEGFKLPIPSSASKPPDNDQADEKQAPAKRERERKRELKESDKETEISERGLLIEILGKATIAEADKNRLLEVFDKSRQREGARRNDFEQSQRQYMWFMMADKERDMGHVRGLTDAFIGLADKYGEVKQQDAKSKVAEIMEVVTLFLQVPIIAQLQNVVLEKLSKPKPLKDPAKEKRRRQLQRELDALSKAEDETPE